MIYITDTETNGQEQLEVIELAYTQVTASLVALQETITTRYKPKLGSSYGALLAHGILDSELENCPPSSEAKLPTNTTYIIGHNIDYDWGALGKPPVKRICTLAMARKLLPALDSHRLGALYYFFFGKTADVRERLKEAHSAGADVFFTYNVLWKLMEVGKEQAGKQLDSVEDLWAFSEWCRVPDVISFGKHKGSKIADLPRDYKAWCLRQPDFDPYILQAIRSTM